MHIGYDEYPFDFAFWFPQEFKTVGISATGGLDTTAIMAACIERYGVDNIHLFHNRHKQTPYVERMAQALGITNLHIFRMEHGRDIAEYKFAKNMWRVANDMVDIDVLYYGMNVNQCPSEFTPQHQHNWGLYLPFHNLNKHHAIDLIIKLGYKDIIPISFSCYHQIDQHCGICKNCLERKQGFKDLGIDDPTIYNTEVHND